MMHPAESAHVISEPLAPDDLAERLRTVGEARYHVHHPFHKKLHAGELGKGHVQAWALNRYAYQRAIPLKDAGLMARAEDPALRRAWRKRIVDHDGEHEGDGGIARWLKLTDDLGLERGYVTSLAGALPATRFAVDAYVRFVREKTLIEAVASSLTEMFAPSIISQRMKGMLANYDFISRETLAYFDKRLSQAPDDADFALRYVQENARTLREQQGALDALIFKCDVLWAQLDALHHAYVEPGHIPPGAFNPEGALTENGQS